MGGLKVAFIGVSHWHFALYTKKISAEELQIVGVCDRSSDVARTEAARLGCRAYTDHRELLSRERPAFVFVFGPHVEMPRIARQLIAERIPFSIEKPAGLRASDVSELARLAERNDVFSSVALVYRLSHEFNAVRALNESGIPMSGHMSFRQFCGPPGRYRENGNPWMLDPARAGGGCLINLGVHFIDLALVFGGGFGEVLSGHLSSGIHHEPVEDYACVHLLLESGASAVIEVGYTMPVNSVEKREMTISFANKNGFVRTVDNGLLTHFYDKPSKRTTVSLDTDEYFAAYRRETLSRFISGAAPVASLMELADTLAVVDTVYNRK